MTSIHLFGALVIVVLASSPVTASDYASLASVNDICAGQPNLEEVETRAVQLGWVRDEQLANDYVELINSIAPAEESFMGNSLAMRSPTSGYLIMLDDEWTGCLYRDPSATEAPVSNRLAEVFDADSEQLEWEISASGSGFLTFPSSDRGLPAQALFVPEGEPGSNFATVGLSIMYEYRKTSS